MKLLVDENLAPSSPAILPAVPRFGSRHRFTFLTKDKDFANLSMIWGPPPKVILLQSGNCSTSATERMIRSNAMGFSDFERDLIPSLLVLR